MNSKVDIDYGAKDRSIEQPEALQNLLAELHGHKDHARLLPNAVEQHSDTTNKVLPVVGIDHADKESQQPKDNRLSVPEVSQKIRLNALEQSSVNSIISNLHSNNLGDLQNTMATLINNPESALKVAAVLNNQLGNEHLWISARVTTDSTGGHSVEFSFNQRDSSSKNSAGVELHYSSNATENDKPMAIATYYPEFGTGEPRSMDAQRGLSVINAASTKLKVVTQQAK